MWWYFFRRVVVILKYAVVVEVEWEAIEEWWYDIIFSKIGSYEKP